ncbi:hypothetical protein D1007_47284 [Hordeum vulgare]|nr:hypothetical protein D1007_47284 [Hordeum vulgare]
MNTTRDVEICLQACDNCTVRWINFNLKPRKTVDSVEGYVIMVAVFMMVLAIGAPMRRRSRSIIIRYGVKGVYILTFPLLSYTVGLMQAGQIKHELYPVWAMFLAMLFGGTSAISVQKLDHNNQQMELYFDTILFSWYIGRVLAGFFGTLGREVGYFPYIFYPMSLLLGFRTIEQWGAVMLASTPSRENGINWLALYMKSEHLLSTSYNPHTMQGYKYPVLLYYGSAKIGEREVTLDNIWCDNMGILSSYNTAPPIRRLKDLCLSFTLFHLVVRRYFGYTCPESKLDKTRDLVFDGLLQEEQDYERAFQVIEAELGFLYDFFFTKYAYIMYGREARWCGISLSLTFLSIAAGTWSLSVLNTHNSILGHRVLVTSTRDILVTKIALVALSIFQFLNIWSYCLSDWAKVSLVCKYVTQPSWQENDFIKKLLLLQGRPHKWIQYWSNNLGQYSILDSFSSSYWDRLKRWLPSGKAGRPIELTTEVKRKVARAIKNSRNGLLSNGTSALVRHNCEELHWACMISQEFTTTHSILVWHIATSYCEISETIRRPEENDVLQNQVVATSLSKYCAYLVAFAPTLLPGSPIETKCALFEIMKEAKGVLQGLMSPTEKYEKLRGLRNVAIETRHEELLAKGVMLGKALESIGNHRVRWDVLADFWVEMLVYIAPSDNVASHIELLAEGGEFVTHVWALLMHAGILERPAPAAAAVP